MVRRNDPASAIAAVDAANFALEGVQPNVVTLAGLLAPGGFVDRRGIPDLDRLRQTLRERVSSVPALCRRPVRTGAAWAWEKAAPDLTRHVRLWADAAGDARPPSVGGLRAFETVCADVVMRRLPLDRPLWELLLVPGVPGGHCGVLFRLHHAVADGLQAEALIAALADGGSAGGLPADEHPDAARSAAAPAPEPAPEHELPPSGTSERRPAGQRLRGAVEQTAAMFRRTVRSRVLLGPLGGARDVALIDVALGELHAGARAFGATVGDAFLASFGHGLRALLAASAETPPTTLPISCPVRLPRQHGEGNATGVMLVPVPVATSDIGEAIALVAAATRAEKARARGAGTFEWMSGPRSAALLMRFARTQRAVAAIASEFPGPPSTLTIAGSELVCAWPLSLLSANVRVGVVGVSYAGRFRVGVQTDAEHLPPAHVVADAMVQALREIAAGGAGRGEA